jgi:nucleoside-diphosphate-sugar epimerase
VITVLGASGFIGSHLVSHLARSGHAWCAPDRDAPLAGRDLGHLIYCIGMTGDFRERPLETVEAHVARLLEVVRTASFDSFLYLSSARLYLRHQGIAREEDPLLLDPADPDDLYNLSKAAGEALILSLGAKGRVVRLANVYGAGQKDTFLASLLADAKSSGVVRLRTALDSQRDYVSVEDTVDLLARIALGGRHRLYNIASGAQVSHARLAEGIAAATGCRILVEPGAPSLRFPPIDVARIRGEFGFVPRDLLEMLPALAAAS